MGVLYDPTKEDRRARGYMAKRHGQQLEALVDTACDLYRHAGIADIEKTPEPMRPIQTTEEMRARGRFVAVYEKRAQPDYKGVLDGGRCICFDAKYTDADRIQQNAVSDAQRERLDRMVKMGGLAYVLVSFAFASFYFIPWPVFRDMKAEHGRQYMTEAECAPYRVKHAAGVPLFLPVPERQRGEE